MEILKFEIVDLGAAPVDTVRPGDTFREELNASILGTGPTAKDAVKNALDQLALDGFGTRLLHEASIEAGYHSEAAGQSALGLYEPQEDDEEDDVIEYHVLIRFEDPTVEAEEVE
jgi:hypothetical protein